MPHVLPGVQISDSARLHHVYPGVQILPVSDSEKLLMLLIQHWDCNLSGHL